MKKVLVLVLVVIMSISIMGCQNNDVNQNGDEGLNNTQENNEKENNEEDNDSNNQDENENINDENNLENEDGNEDNQEDLEPVTLKISFFKGGYGDQWLKDIVGHFEEEYPNVTVEMQGDPGIMEKMEAVLQSGANLPDVAYLLNTHWQRWASSGLLADLTDLYEGDAFDKDVPFKETMNKAAQEYSLYKDKAYIIPWSDGVLGMVYNAGMFEEYGWQVPNTWAEFDELAKEIKEEGIAPFVYPGRVIGYWDFVVNTMMVQEGGFEFLEQTLAMESPEVFNLPARLKAYEEYESWFEKDYMLDGSEALNHTESQMEFLQGKAAMIPNGSWLENEMINALPEGFRMKMMRVPAFEGAKEPDVFYSMVGDIILVPEKSKNQEWAKEFIRFSSSEKMNQIFTKTAGAFRPFDYTLDGVGVTEFTKSTLEIMQNNQAFTLNTTSPMYLRMGFNPSGNAVGSIAFGDYTAKEVVKNDYNKAKDKWDEYKEELGIE